MSEADQQVESTETQAAASETSASEAPAEASGTPRLGTPAFGAAAIPDPSTTGPSGVFLAVVAVGTLVADVSTKLWAEHQLEGLYRPIKVIDGHLQFILAKNLGGAWGLFDSAHESWRRPFFLLVSVAAISFIVSLYRKLTPKQLALKWGLPLVLGGALGNVFDRVRYGYVIDFIDYYADWVRSLNELVAKYSSKHYVTDHWPTFNIADVAICAGVVLMAIDMFTTKRVSPPQAGTVPLGHVSENEHGVAVLRQPAGVGATPLAPVQIDRPSSEPEQAS